MPPPRIGTAGPWEGGQGGDLVETALPVLRHRPRHGGIPASGNKGMPEPQLGTTGKLLLAWAHPVGVEDAPPHRVPLGGQQMPVAVVSRPPALGFVCSTTTQWRTSKPNSAAMSRISSAVCTRVIGSAGLILK